MNPTLELVAGMFYPAETVKALAAEGMREHKAREREQAAHVPDLSFVCHANVADDIPIRPGAKWFLTGLDMGPEGMEPRFSIEQESEKASIRALWAKEAELKAEGYVVRYNPECTEFTAYKPETPWVYVEWEACWRSVYVSDFSADTESDPFADD